MSYEIRSRTDIGLPAEVLSSSGSHRPLVRQPAIYCTYHWPGVNVNFGDIGDTDAEIRGIEDFARSTGKPNEYNWVIHQDPDEFVHEYAGRFRAAHSAGENGISHGFLILNGINEPLLARQTDKIQWLNQVLRYFGMTNLETLHRPHNGMPGAATACPGPTIGPAVPTFGDPWEEAAPPPVDPPTPPPSNPVPVPPPDSDDEGFYLITKGSTPWGISAEIYGTGTRWPEIMEANEPDDTPNPRERWIVPGFTGEWTTVQSGEGPWQIIDRIFGEGTATNEGVDQFWQWNGGDPTKGGRNFGDGLGPRALQEGERVWVRG